jgi:hypothetical protein
LTKLSRELTDDAAQLAWERQRLADARAKLERAGDAGDRVYYTKCVQGWERSIAVLERRIQDKQGDAHVLEES